MNVESAGDVVEVLLVEDNAADAELTMRVLQRQRIINHVRWVKDGAEAIQFLFGDPQAGQEPAQCTRPRMILLDLKLPKIDGLEVLRRIKRDPAMAAVPVVIMTSSKEEQDLVESYRLGVNSYVVKPVDYTAFAESVLQLGRYWLVVNQTPKG